MTAPPAPPVRVLLVDDQPLFRRAIATLVDAQPDLAVVGEAENGLRGVELARALRPDLVVLDVEMPVMNGVEAVRLIRDQVPEAKVVMLTVSEEDDFLLAAVRNGAHGYLLKDLEPDQLYDMLRLVVRGRSPVSPTLAGRLLAEVRATGSVVRPSTPDQPLSPRELEIMRLVADGLSNRQIASRLFLSEGTVKNHVHNALQKLEMDNRIQAATYIVRQGLAGAPGT